MKFNGICIFGNLRTGSTYLCQQLAEAMEKVHGKKVLQLYEYLSSAVSYTKDWQSVLIDPTHRIPRPFTTALDLDRLRKIPVLIEDGNFPIMKIFPEDYTHSNYHLLHQTIIDNDSIYKICLNRLDVKNQFLSYFIARSTNKFHVYRGDLPEQDRGYKRLHVTKSEMEEIRNVILLHYNWHATNAKSYCHKVVWYHQMRDVEYLDLGLGKQDLIYDRQIKAVNDHESMAKKCIENFSETWEYASKLETDLFKLKTDLC